MQGGPCRFLERPRAFNIEIMKMEMKLRAKTQLERMIDPNPPFFEEIDDVVETIEGQALTVNEILVKFSQGTLGNIGKDAYYDDDEDFFDPTLDPDFDLSDAYNYLQELEAHGKEVSERIEKKVASAQVDEPKPVTEPPTEV